MPTPTTRLAPSPTGALHLGNARTFLINWAMARQEGMRLIMRIEDLDGPRVKTGADAQAIEDLRWLGVDWDGPVLYQRHDLSPYEGALARLRDRGVIYPCRCTRSDIRLAQRAPHRDEHELRYPGTCRPSPLPAADIRHGPNCPADPSDTTAAWRLSVPDEPITFTDRVHGPQCIDVQKQVGDFIVATKARLPAYQLAVVVDDARQGVTDVIRGDDLVASTARQLWLYRQLQLAPPRCYTHLPLVLGPDGRRLAKRHGDSRLAWYRQHCVPPERVVGLIAWWCGLLDRPQPLSPQEFLDGFSLDRVPTAPVTLAPEDHQWLVNA